MFVNLQCRFIYKSQSVNLKKSINIICPLKNPTYENKLGFFDIGSSDNGIVAGLLIFNKQ